jgi:hypothetical protein
MHDLNFKFVKFASNFNPRLYLESYILYGNLELKSIWKCQIVILVEMIAPYIKVQIRHWEKQVKGWLRYFGSRFNPLSLWYAQIWVIAKLQNITIKRYLLPTNGLKFCLEFDIENKSCYFLFFSPSVFTLEGRSGFDTRPKESKRFIGPTLSQFVSSQNSLCLIILSFFMQQINLNKDGLNDYYLQV